LPKVLDAADDPASVKAFVPIGCGGLMCFAGTRFVDKIFLSLSGISFYYLVLGRLKYPVRRL
jgi:hypothetical protein